MVESREPFLFLLCSTIGSRDIYEIGLRKDIFNTKAPLCVCIVEMVACFDCVECHDVRNYKC